MRYSPLPLIICLLAAGQACSDDLQACVAIDDAGARLDCYDRLAGRASGVMPAVAETGEPVMTESPHPEVRQEYAFGQIRRDVSPLADRWELEPETRRPIFTFRPYKPVYFMPVVHSDNPNQRPCSEGSSGLNCVAEDLDLDPVEAKLQLSFKTKVWGDVFGDNGDLWLAYTQSSRWQVYNDEGSYSRPFRETDYEPEALMSFRVDYDLWGWRLRLLGLGLNHQSNGQSEPLSRSWNRVTAFAGLERQDWVLGLRTWYRLPEQEADDQNPDIEDFIGRGELIVNRRAGRQNFSLTLRHSLAGGEANRGSGLFEWTFPLSGYLKGYFQLFSGYGENLLDYNHRQTTAGLGITLVDWQ